MKLIKNLWSSKGKVITINDVKKAKEYFGINRTEDGWERALSMFKFYGSHHNDIAYSQGNDNDLDIA